MARILHYFHISHTRAETHVNPFALSPAWILKEWEEAEKIIDSLDLPFDRTKIYQDSLPDYSDIGFQSFEHSYPTETALQLLELNLNLLDSPNYRILHKLVRKGCRLMVTESLEHMKMFAFLWQERPPDFEFLFKKLVSERDPFIAQQVNSTLDIGDTGILFLGKDHRIADNLDEDIEVRHYFCSRVHDH